MIDGGLLLPGGGDVIIVMEQAEMIEPDFSLV
jgi:hypothetical protein